jgi:VanZ family protein
LNALSLWGPVVLVMAGIFVVSSMPDPGGPPLGMSDKSAHALAYALLGAALVRALASGRAERLTSGRLVAAIVLTSLYGVSDELHQRFVPGRTPDWLDVLADAAGAVAGVLAMAGGLRMLDRLRRRGPAHDARV